MIQVQKVSWFARLCIFTFLANLQILSAGVNDGLVGWWKLDEGSGISSSDSSGNDRSLALQNGVAWTDGVYGRAVDLDGNDDQISLSNLEVDGNFSVSLWAKPLSSTHIGGYESSSENNSISYLNRTIVKPAHGQGTDFGIGLSVGTNGISSLIHASSIYCQPLIYSASLSSWTHIVLVLDNRLPKLYVNGDLARTGLTLSRPVKLQISSGSPIGKGYDNDDRYHGGVDDFRIYDRVLSVDEINQLYDFPVGLHTVGSISVIENSLIGSIIGEFNATDPNGDSLSFTLSPSLPNQFSPVLWLDANDSSSVINSGGSVSEWRDKSGNNYHFTQNVDNSKRPLYSATSLNGMPSVTFDGSNDYLSISSRLGFSANPDISVFAVTRFVALVSNDERIFQLGTNTHGLAVAGGTGSWCWRFNGGHERYNDVNTSTAALQAWVRHENTNYAASRFFYNGLEQSRVGGSSDASSPTNDQEIAIIGKSAAAGNFANVKISELIVLNDSSEISRKAMETYLARKWGLNYPHATSNGIFELESNGTLKSLVSLDREAAASYPIVVRATDTNGNFIDQNFSVLVLDDGQEDTDGDGFLDSIEITSGSNENNASSVPANLPLFLGQATLWLDATNVDLKQNTTLSNGGSISQWKDQSGNGKHLSVINSAYSPVLNADLVNLKDVVSFTGDSLKTTEAISVRSILAVHKTLNSHYLWDFRDGVANSWIYSASVGSYWNQHISNGVLQNSVNGGLVMNNQLQISYFAGSSNGSGTFYLHSRYSNNEMGTGDICELLIYDRLLTQQEIDDGEIYLAHKWGLSNIIDSDSDGFSDSVEYQEGSDPGSNTSIPGLDYGMVAWYPFDGNTSDMSGNDRDATAVNTHSFVSGKIGSGVRIVGSDSGVAGHVMLPYISSLENSDTTFALWVWEETMLHSHGEAYLAYGQIESVHNYIGGQSFNFGSNTYVSGITRASWNHYAVTKAGSVRKGYLNGTLVAQGSWSAPASYSPTESALGRHWWSGTAASSTRLIAIFDDLRIYDRALPTNEITSLQTWTSVTNSPPANLYPQSSLIIAENNPVGSLVGQFSATDADGDYVSYLLVTGAGDTANSYFTLESNGTLKTAVIFDYENNASSFSIRVQAKDEHLGTTEGNFTIFLHDLDDTAPVITLTGATSVTHEAGTPYLDANASWTDAVDGSGVVYASGVVDAGVPGTYQLTYNYTDVAGNVAQEIIRTVEVVDTTAPVINLVGGVVVTHPVGSVYSDSGASWNDAVDGAGTISSIGSINYMSPGTYSLSYDYTDQAGNAAQSIVRTVNVVNSPPDGLAVINDQNLTLFENEPNGTLLGQFVGADPNSNTQFGYELISVFDANDSSLLLENAFQVASNGTLRSLRSFDYEVDPRKYILSVRVNDQFGLSFSRSFTAYVRNMVEDLDGDGIEDHYDLDDDGDGFEDSVEVAYGHDPDDNQSMPRLALIETIAPSFDGNRSYTLSGTILSSGGVPLTSYGIVIIEQNGTESYYEAETIEADFNATFHVLFANLKAGKTYQYSSFVRNFVGESRGQFLRVEVEEKIDPFAWWVDSRELDGGWRESDWLGTFLRNSENGWVYHLDLAWVFTRSDGTGGMWMWRNEEESWLWAEPNTWPFLWSDLTKDWLYFIFLEGKIKIFDYSQGSFR